MKCYQCHHEWETKLKEGLPKVCPDCQRDWRAPTLIGRFKGARDGFLQKPKPFREIKFGPAKPMTPAENKEYHEAIEGN